MSGLPRKYAKMGFKRGWAAYKKSKKTKSKRSVKTMARRRKRRTARARTRTVYKTRRSKSSPLAQTLKLGLAGAAYGAFREPINQAAKKIPFIGGFSDELVMLGVSGLGNVYGKGWMKKMAQAGLVIEGQNISRTALAGTLSGLFGTSSTSTESSSTSGATF